MTSRVIESMEQKETLLLGPFVLFKEFAEIVNEGMINTHLILLSLK